MKKVRVGNFEIECSVCKNRAPFTRIMESDASMAPDLDLRPSQPHRKTMMFWVTECPECGYCHGSVALPFSGERSYFESEEYKNCGGISAENPLTVKFLKKALVCMKNGEMIEAVQSYLYAAWTADDDKNEKLAADCRHAAIALIENNPESFKGNDNIAVLKADMLRRCGDFEQVISEYKGRRFSNPLFGVLCDFQVKLALKKDSRVYTTDSIPGVKAR